MGFFSKTKNTIGWMAFSLRPDGICVAAITRKPGTRPVVELMSFSPPDAAPATLEKIARESHGDRYRRINLLGASEYQLLSVDAPNVPAEELKTAIRWRVKDMLDFAIDEATVDVLDVPVDQNAAARGHAMYVIAARNQLIEQRQNLFERAKAPLHVIDIPEMAQRNIAALFAPEGRGVALLSFGPDGGLLTFTYAGELYLSRRIDVTPNQLAQADAEQRSALFERITLELQRSLDHFDRQYHFITLSKLLLAPLGEAGSGLIDYLSPNLYLPVETINLESVLDMSKVPELKSPEVQQKYFMTLGAGLRDEETAS